MKRLLPLIVLLVLALVAGVWWISRGGRAASQPVHAEPAAALAAVDETPRATPLDGPPSTTATPAATTPLAQDRPARRDERVSVEEAERRAAAARARIVRGRVSAPAGCSIAGDRTVVYAAARSLTGAELFWLLRDEGSSPSRADRRALAVTDPDAAFPLLGGADEDEDEAAADEHDGDGSLHADLVASAHVADDGTFELALEPDAPALWLVLSGRRLYGAEAYALAPDATDEVVLGARCGAVLAGRLLPPRGSPDGVPDDVELLLRTQAQGGINPDQFVHRKLAVAADGRYEFRALPTGGGPLALLVESDAVAASRFDVATLVPGEEREQDLALVTGARVRGRVVDDAGRPVAEADVEARESGRFFGFDDRKLREAETDDDGRFELENVLPGSVRLVAEAKGYLESDGVAVELVDGGTHEGTLVELGRGAAIEGRVTWPDGSPAAGAEVDVDFDMAHLAGMGAFNMRRGADGDAETDADGRFRVTGLGKGPFTVKASARPAKGEARHRARADGVQPREMKLELVLEPPMGLTGRVVSAHDGTPVTAFEVSGHEASDGLLGALGKEQAKSEFEDEQGRFFLEGLRGGAWTIHVRADGFAASEPLEAALPQPEGEELVVELAPQVLVKGHVVSPSGTPVAGATVRVDTGQPQWREQIDEATGFASPRAQSGADGAFELAGLAPGAHALFARSEDWARSESVNVDLVPGEDLEDVTIVLRAGGTLTGEVWNDEEPAAGFFVQVTRMETFDQRVAFVDADGTFELEHVDEGTWQIVAMSSSGTGLSATSDEDDDGAAALGDMMSQLKMTVADVVEGEITHVVLGAAAADPVKVHGRVTHAGTPYSGAIVTFYAEGENVMESMRNTSVAKDGTYSVELGRPGQYVIQIQKVGSMGQQRLVEFTRLVPEGKPELELDFEVPIGRVSGLVEGPDGAPAGGVRVSLHPEGALETGTLWGGQYAETTTERDGRYDIEGLRPGRYSLMAGGAAYGATVGTPHGRVARSIVLGEGEWLRDEDFRLPEASKVKVKVVDASGKPVAEAAVFARDASGRLLDRLSMITTDAGGNAEYAGLGEGRYSLAARKDGLASLESPPVKLSEGGSADVELRMQPGTMLVITIAGDDEELLNAHISVRDADGHEVNGMLSLANLTKLFGQGFSTKEHKVGPLPPGKYVVEATGPGGEKVKKPVTLSGQDERKLRLKFD